MKEITKEAYEVIFDALDNDFDLSDINYFLCDGFALEQEGYGDDDIELINEASSYRVGYSFSL